MKLLLTSVGTMLGQNIMDVLDCPGYSRRSLTQVVSTNSQAEAANNFRCDRCYLVPPTASAEHPERMRGILLAERPDLILCCRDEDMYALSQLKAQHPDLPGVLPVGGPRAALIGFDKWQTALFARRHGLSFAESFMPVESGDSAALRSFCQQVGFPLIAKPTRDAGSRGVCYVRDERDLDIVMERKGYLLQEYLGDSRSLEAYFASLQGPVPLFAQSPDANYHVAHTVIAPDGQIAPILVTENHTVAGHTVLNKRVLDPVIEGLMVDFVRALLSEGGHGPFSVQLRRDRHGAWKAHEINLRTTGGTFTRFLFGLDELYFIIKAFMPDVSFPKMQPSESDPCDLVSRQYYPSAVFASNIAALTDAGVWSRS